MRSQVGHSRAAQHHRFSAIGLDGAAAFAEVQFERGGVAVQVEDRDLARPHAAAVAANAVAVHQFLRPAD